MTASIWSALSPTVFTDVVKPMRLPRAPNMFAGLERGFEIGTTVPKAGVCWVMAQTLSAGPSFWNRRRMPMAIFRARPVDAQVGDETSEEIVHMPLTSPALSAGWPHIRQAKVRNTSAADKSHDALLHSCISGIAHSSLIPISCVRASMGMRTL